jgi:hypothetical protein
LEQAMTPREILAHVRQAPFVPFRLVLVDGAKYDILHPEQCMVMKRDLLIGSMDRNDQFVEWTLKLNSHNVVRVEPLLAEAVTG